MDNMQVVMNPHTACLLEIKQLIAETQGALPWLSFLWVISKLLSTWLELSPGRHGGAGTKWGSRCTVSQEHALDPTQEEWSKHPTGRHQQASQDQRH